MAFDDLVNYRRSIRKFSDKTINEGTLKDIIKTAERTPSWANAQAWQVYVATGDTLKQIKQHHLESVEKGISGRSDFATMHRDQWTQVAQHNMAKWSSNLQEYLGENASEYSEAQAHLFNAAALVYLVLPKNASLWSVYDLGAFGQTLMLAAADQKIDSMPAYEIVKYPDDVRKIMRIPADNIIAMGIALGYRDSEAKINGFRSDRVSLDEILTIRK